MISLFKDSFNLATLVCTETTFSARDILTCHSRGSTGVIDSMSNVCIPFGQNSFRVMLLCMHAN